MRGRKAGSQAISVAITLEACHAKEIIEKAFASTAYPKSSPRTEGSQFTARRVEG